MTTQVITALGGTLCRRDGAWSWRDGEIVRRAHIRPGEDPLLGAEPLDHAPGPIPRVALVPAEEWDAWARSTPLGAEWDRADEPAILARAYELGWRPPEDWTAPSGWRAP